MIVFENFLRDRQSKFTVFFCYQLTKFSIYFHNMLTKSQFFFLRSFYEIHFFFQWLIDKICYFFSMSSWRDMPFFPQPVVIIRDAFCDRLTNWFFRILQKMNNYLKNHMPEKEFKKGKSCTEFFIMQDFPILCAICAIPHAISNPV